MRLIDNSRIVSIDREKLLERCLGIGSFADKLAHAFISTLPIERKALREAVASNDLTQVAKQAHRMRGSASNLCAVELSTAAEAVESAARSECEDNVLRLFNDVESAIDRLLTEFENSDSTP
ncbi:MAG: Hpt domain-containing protein [Pirellulaceae bacterium]|nr:Hpt domain-containing protein [Pirellulaceae bacterium]